MAKIVKKTKEVVKKSAVKVVEKIQAPTAKVNDLGNSPCTACDRGFNRITREVCSVCNGTPEN